LTDADREELYRCVADLKSPRVVITHGTDTMTATAARLASIQGKTIVMTGALTPARFSESDAPFNLGMAFATAQTAPPGVFIVMNGEVFPAGTVQKNREASRFVRVDPPGD
jgi:L-asparaginase